MEVVARNHAQERAMLKRAVLYARVSTDEQAKGYSLQTQLEACRNYAIERGYTVTAEFKDDISGASMDRPGLNELREFIATDATSVIVVYDVDRLARKSVYQMLIEEELNRAGAIVEYVIGQYADSDEGRLQKQIRASIAEYEKAKIMERSKRGKRGKAKSGYVLVGNRPPYGYRVKSEPHKSWLEVDGEEAKIVRMVFDWYVHGDKGSKPLSINGIAQGLTTLRIPTRGDKFSHVAKKFGAGIWQPAMIKHILTNETYIGTWYFGKTHVISDGKEHTRKPKSKTGFGKQVPKSREDWIPVEVPGIVDKDLWKVTQARLLHNKRALAGRPAYNEYLLRGRLRCSKCNYGARGQVVKGKHRYYICVGTRQIVSRCDMPSFRGDWLDEAAWLWLKGLMQDRNKLLEGLKASQEEKERVSRTSRERLEIIEGQLKETEAQLSRLLDLYLSGEFSKELLIERKSRLEKTLVDQKYFRDQLVADLQIDSITDIQIAEIETFCAEVRVGLDNATFEDKVHYFELFDMRGKLAIENEEKVVYLTCKLGKQRVLQMRTSPSSNTGATAIIPCACRSTRRCP